MSNKVQVFCPKCKTEFVWDLDNPASNPHRPFCSASCKNSDFLKWANGEYKISRPLTMDDEEIAEIEKDLENSADVKKVIN